MERRESSAVPASVVQPAPCANVPRHLALQALAKEGKKARVVSMVCWELFEEQSQQYKDSVLPPAVTARVSVEAGSSFGWHKCVRRVLTSPPWPSPSWPWHFPLLTLNCPSPLAQACPDCTQQLSTKLPPPGTRPPRQCTCAQQPGPASATGLTQEGTGSQGPLHPLRRYLGTYGKHVGIDSFGASAPAPILYEKFGITLQVRPQPGLSPPCGGGMQGSAMFLYFTYKIRLV
jgi:hypothetical protein